MKYAVRIIINSELDFNLNQASFNSIIEIIFMSLSLKIYILYFFKYFLQAYFPKQISKYLFERYIGLIHVRCHTTSL